MSAGGRNVRCEVNLHYSAVEAKAQPDGGAIYAGKLRVSIFKTDTTAWLNPTLKLPMRKGDLRPGSR